jgi:hypothetical protein
MEWHYSSSNGRCIIICKMWSDSPHAHSRGFQVFFSPFFIAYRPTALFPTPSRLRPFFPAPLRRPFSHCSPTYCLLILSPEWIRRGRWQIRCGGGKSERSARALTNKSGSTVTVSRCSRSLRERTQRRYRNCQGQGLRLHPRQPPPPSPAPPTASSFFPVLLRLAPLLAAEPGPAAAKSASAMKERALGGGWPWG